MKTAKILYAHGCKRADAEIAVLHDYLVKNGYDIIKDIKAADMVFVCTCGFDASSESVSLNILRKTASAVRPDATLVAFGCLAGINEEAIRKRCGNRVLTVPPRNLNDLDRIIGATVGFQRLLDNDQRNAFYVNQSVMFKASDGHPSACTPDCINVVSRNTFSATNRLLVKLLSSKDLVGKFISRFDQLSRLVGPGEKGMWISGLLLSIGCPGECTYCGIRRAAGPLYSIPLQTILKRFQNSLEQGNKVIALVAADVGAYGQDRRTNVVHLLDELFAIKEEYMMLISDFHPRWLAQYSDPLIRLLAQNQKRIEHISIPMQSGSEKILSLMKRHVSAAQIRTHVKKLKQAAPEIPVATHVLVGFPGETDEDFKQTLELLHEIDFDYVCAFSYTDRPGTPASLFPGKVPAWKKHRRLIALQRQFKMKRRNDQPAGFGVDPEAVYGQAGHTS